MGKAGRLYRRARAIVAASPTGFTWVEDRRLAASGYPSSKRQVEWVMRHGIDSVVTLTEDPLPKAWTQLPGLVSVHLAMVDHAPPSAQSLDGAAERIKSELDAGRNVLVHCLAGRGRTMCALAAYLIRYEGLGGEEAIGRLRTLRRDAVESGQEAAVLSYAAARMRER